MGTVEENAASWGSKTPDEICARAQPLLDRIVRGIMTFTEEFDGPNQYSIGSVPYTTLCSQGAKPQGDAGIFFGHDEALRLYAAELTKFVGEAGQIAWRCRPRFEADEAVTPVRYRVYSRLAVPV